MPFICTNCDFKILICAGSSKEALMNVNWKYNSCEMEIEMILYACVIIKVWIHLLEPISFYFLINCYDQKFSHTKEKPCKCRECDNSFLCTECKYRLLKPIKVLLTRHIPYKLCELGFKIVDEMMKSNMLTSPKCDYMLIESLYMRNTVIIVFTCLECDNPKKLLKLCNIGYIVCDGIKRCTITSLC